jgi:hypothetical protein
MAAISRDSSYAIFRGSSGFWSVLDGGYARLQRLKLFALLNDSFFEIA